MKEKLIKLIYGWSNSRYENKGAVEIWLSSYEEVEKFADAILALLPDEQTLAFAKWVIDNGIGRNSERETD